MIWSRQPVSLRRPIRGTTSVRWLDGPGWRTRGMTSVRWLGGLRWRIRGMTRPRRLGGPRWRSRGMTRRRQLGGPRRRMIRGTGGPRRRTMRMARLRSVGGRRRTPGTAGLRRIRGMTSLRWLGGPRWRSRGMTRRRQLGGPRRPMIRGTGGPRRRTMGMARLRSVGGRQRTPGPAGLRRWIRGMTSLRWLGGRRRIQGLAGRPRMIQGSASLRGLAGRRPSTRGPACLRSPIPVSAAPLLLGRVPVAAAVRVPVTSGPLSAALTAAGIVVPQTRALLAARRLGLRLARLARDRHPLARLAATQLLRGKHRARKFSRLQSASLPVRLSRREAPERRAVGYRRECSRWPVPRPSWRELSPSS
jgi:hypothetical protein